VAKAPRLILKGDKELIRKLKRLSKPRQIRKVLRSATTAGGQVLVKHVRRIWNAEAKDSGLSGRSVAKKIIKTRSGFSAIIGIDKDAASEGEDGKRHVPSNIDHLIEFGFQHRSGKTVPAVAPLRRGYESGKAEAERVFATKAAKEIEKEAAKRG
jgi:hypothetical protein